MKKIFVVILILIITVALLFRGIRQNKIRNVSNPNAVERQSTQTDKDKKQVLPVVNNNIIYDILGTSEKPKYPDEDLIKTREQMKSLTSKYPSKMFINGLTDQKLVALTFDDGPAGAVTEQIIKILKDNNVKATFFCVGNLIGPYKKSVSEAYNNGNLIENHSWTHPHMTKISAEELNNEVKKTEDEIFKVTGKRPALIRPPYGDINESVEDTLDKNGYKTVLWSTETLDWAQHDSQNIIKNAVDNVRPGEIILMHCLNSEKATAEALPTIISKLREKGYKLVGLDEMLNCPAYK